MDNTGGDSDSEEEILVFADFKDLLDQDVLKPGNLRIVKAIGMDSETPVVQLNNYFFQGEFQNCLGTQMFFENEPDPPEGDPIFDIKPAKSLKYLCKTRKILNMKRIFLRPKEDVSPAEDVEIVAPEVNTQASTVEEALHNFQVYFDENDIDLPVTKSNKPLGVMQSQKPTKRPKKPKIWTLNDFSEEEND